MGEIETDSRGYVTIPKEIREWFGKRYRLVELDDGIRLVPIPDDPIAVLRRAASDEFEAASMDKLRITASEEGRDQAFDEIEIERVQLEPDERPDV